MSKQHKNASPHRYFKPSLEELEDRRAPGKIFGDLSLSLAPGLLLPDSAPAEAVAEPAPLATPDAYSAQDVAVLNNMTGLRGAAPTTLTRDSLAASPAAAPIAPNSPSTTDDLFANTADGRFVLSAALQDARELFRTFSSTAAPSSVGAPLAGFGGGGGGGGGAVGGAGAAPSARAMGEASSGLTAAAPFAGVHAEADALRTAFALNSAFPAPAPAAVPVGTPVSNSAGSLGGAQFEDLVVDGDTSPGVAITGPTVLTEGGSSGTLNVRLKVQPTDSVTVNLSADLSLFLSASALNFSPSDWSTPKTVTVSAVTDAEAEGYHVGVIQTYTAASNDPNYNAINGDNLIVNILDANGPNAVDDVVETTAGAAVPSINALPNDTDPNGYTLSVVGYTQGIDGGTVSLNTDQTFSYTPVVNYTGLDNFTYTISNGHGQTTSGYVFVHVAPVNHAPSLSPIANLTNNEDDSVSFQVIGNDPDNDQVYYSATNLPAGVNIDALTGQIYGVIGPNAANPIPNQPILNTYTYHVTVQGQDGLGLSSSTSFDWTINHTNHSPWIEFPGALVGTAGQAFSYQVVAHDLDVAPGMASDTLSYSALGLPASLSINSATGSVSGNLTAADVGAFRPTVTVNDGLVNASQTFTLTVLPSGTQIPTASIWINGTSDTSDDVMLEGTTAPAQIVGTPGATVYLTSTGPVSLSQSQVTLDSSGTAMVQIIPTGLSTAVDDVHVIASVIAQPPQPQPPQQVVIDEKALSKMTITLPDVNRPYTPYNTLPNGSQTHDLYRIPPGIDTPYTVTLSLDLSRTTHMVELAQQERDDYGGTFTINGKQNPLIQKTTTVLLRGGQMTAPGAYGSLSIIATAGRGAVSSNWFSVSAIPIKLRPADMGRNGNPKAVPLNMKYRDGTTKVQNVRPYSAWVLYWFDSDSGDIANLDIVWFGEYVSYVSAANNPPWNIRQNIPAAFSYIQPRPRDKYTATLGTIFDNFVMPGDKLPQPQQTALTVNQWYGFRDGRSESVTPADNTHAYQNDIAYFSSVRKIYQDTDKAWLYNYTRFDGNGKPAEPVNGLNVFVQKAP